MFREKVIFKTLTEAKADHTNEFKGGMDQIVNYYSIRVSIVKLIALILAKKRFLVPLYFDNSTRDENEN